MPRTFTFVIPVLFAAVIVSGCAQMERAKVAAKAKTQMVGMSNEQVLACMGAPDRKASVGATTVWTYESGGDLRVASTGGTNHVITRSRNHNRGRNNNRNGNNRHSNWSFGSVTTTSEYMSCTVNVTMRNDRVSRINYLGRTGVGRTADEQCGFVLQHCVQ